MSPSGRSVPGDPVLDEILSVMPVGYREMMGRMQAWTTRLVLAYADGDAERVEAIHAQIDGWRRPIWDGAPEPMPQWKSARRQAAATFDDLRDAGTRASRRQIGEGAAQLVRGHGPAKRAEQIMALAVDFAAGRPATAFEDLSEEQADEAAALFYCAAAGWLFNRVFLAREAGRLGLMAKIRDGEQIALGVPSPEWGTDIPDAAAIRLLGELLELEPAMLPPVDAEQRNLLEHDLVGAAKLHLLEHPDSSEEDRAALRSHLLALIASFEVPEQVGRAAKHQPSPSAYSAPRPGQRPHQQGKKRRR